MRRIFTVIALLSLFYKTSAQDKKDNGIVTQQVSNGNSIDICEVLPILNSSNSICYTGDFSFSTSTASNYNYIGGLQTNFGCLYTQPNQTWFVITVTSVTSANHSLSFTFPNNNSYDIDAAIWGPIYQDNLSNACSSLYNTPLTCDYDTQDPDLTIPNAEVGRKYILVITNYQNSANVLQITQPTGGTVQYCTPKCPTIPTPTILASSTNINCGQSVTLSATGCVGGASAAWSNGLTGSTISVTPTQNTTYTATCSNNGCISSNSNPISVSIQGMTAPVISASSTNLSCGQSSTLTASGCSGTILWSSGLTGTSLTVTPTQKTTYSAQCKIGNCFSTASNRITIALLNTTIPTISASSSTITCGQSTTLTANGCSGTITWSNGSTGSSLIVTPSSTTIYRATCTVNTCTSGEALKTITVNALSPLSVSGSTSSITCGQSVVLTATGTCSGTIKWSNGSTGASVSVSPKQTTTYKAICLSSPCLSTESNSFTVNLSGVGAPSISASRTALSCGQSSTLTATNCTGGTVKWSDGSVGASITVTPYTNTAYKATCTNSSGCVSGNSNTLNLTISSSITTPSITASATNVTCGQSITLSATGCNGTVTWVNGLTGNSVTTTPTTNTTYTAVCSTNGCTSTASNAISVTINNLTAPNITTTANSISCGQSTTLTATGCASGTTVSWSDGSTGSTITVSPSISTIYSAKCVFSSCISSSSNSITINISSDTADDTYLNATVISGNTFTSTAKGICPSGDVDWYKISIYNRVYYVKVRGYANSATGQYSLSFTNNNGVIEIETLPVNGNSTDTYLELYNATGTLMLRSDDDSGVGVFSKISYCNSSLILTHSPDDYIDQATPIIQRVSSTIGKITANNWISGNGTNVSYLGSSIELTPGFIADSGVVFSAQTGGCQ